MLSHELPSERMDIEEIRKQATRFESVPFFVDFFDSVFDVVLILNECRQVILANSRLMEQFNIDPHLIRGKRPGEVLDCVNAFHKFGGCGTSEFCRTCGAAQALHDSRGGKCQTQECRIRRRNDLGALDLKVNATPTILEGEPFTIFAIKDISHQKRRRILERIFFHDVLNIAGNIQGLTELLELGIEGNVREYIKMLAGSTQNLIEEIQAQRELSAAEMNDLEVKPVLVNTGTILRELVDNYARNPVTDGRGIRLHPDIPDIFFTTDKTLLLRVLGNMLKNALEAVRRGETVTVGCAPVGDGVQFWIQNPGIISEEVRLQLFQRSFSTKGGGRGLGTYSIKLLGEKFLKGKISFISNEHEGTIFSSDFSPRPSGKEIETN